MSKADVIPVLLVDDHPIWRGGVRAMLTDTEFCVVREASSGREALEVVQQAHPRVALLDIRMAGGDGFEALTALKEALPEMAVLMLTTYDNPTYMARAVAGGAAGYLLKGASRQEMLCAMRAVVNGECLLSSRQFVKALHSISEGACVSEELFQPLTNRELEVLKLVATGINNREIGKILFISEGTVKSHVEHILGKLGASDRVQAAVWAARQGLTADVNRE